MKDIDTSQLLRWIAYTIAVLFLSLQFFLQIASTAMVKPLMNDFKVGQVGVSSLSAMLFYGYIFWLIPAGLMLDYFGSKKSILFACLALGIGSLIFGYSHNISTAILGRLIMGIGSSYAFINMLYVANSFFPSKNFAFIAGLGETISTFTASICAMSLPFWISHFSWRFVITSSGWLSIVLFVSILLLLKKRDETKRYCNKSKRIVVIQSFLTLTKDKKLWLLGIYGLCVFSLITVFTSLWGVPFITNVYHYSTKNAATAVMMIPLGIGVGCLFIGFVTRAFKHKYIMLIATITGTVLMSTVIYVPGIEFFSLLLLLFFCGFFSSTYIQAYAIAQTTYSADTHGSIASIITIIIMGGAPILQIILGWLLHTNFFNFADNVTMNFRLSFLIVPLCLTIAFVIALRLNEFRDM